VIPRLQACGRVWVISVSYSSLLIPPIPATLPMNEGIVEEPRFYCRNADQTGDRKSGRGTATAVLGWETGLS